MEGVRTVRNGDITLRAGVALAASLLLAGCGIDNGVDAQGPVPPTSLTLPAPVAPVSPSASADGSPAPGTPASPSVAPGDERGAILAQYRAFFGSLTPLSGLDSKTRYEALNKVAVEPELSRAMGGMAAAQQAGEAYYGTPVLRPKIDSVEGDTVTILDCQDTSVNGRVKVATGEKVTVGRKNSYAQITMKRGSDGVWRVATIGYAAAGSCNAEA